MKAHETRLVDFLKGPKQFIIPIYQRTYSWTLKQCEQLWEDILRAAKDESESGHFIGSVVYIEKGLYQISSIPQLLVIDGQQRLTTVSILLAALGRSLKEKGDVGDISQKKLTNYFLINDEESGDLRMKLLLTQNDKETLARLVESTTLPNNPSRRVMDNFDFFEECLRAKEVDLAAVYKGISKLLVIDVALDRVRDNPQLIFESLNSTGLELSQADLIRNYVLMRLEPKEQEAIYNEYWHQMEDHFGQTDYAQHFDKFMRDYLTIKMGRIPNIDQVYEAFKEHTQQGKMEIRPIIGEIYEYAKYYVSIAFGRNEELDLADAFIDLNSLKVDVAYPFLLEVYNDYRKGLVDKASFLQIIRTIESYVFRRAVCEIPTNSLNKTFATLSKEIDKTKYLESFKAALLIKDSYRRFPDDNEFAQALMMRDMYNSRTRNYWLRKLENKDRKELVNVEEYTIEHIMPQNENLSAAWRECLGSEWKEIQAKYLHTIGNLTLTGYNSELSDKSFIEKRDMEGGFADSPIRLNADLASLNNWDVNEIQKRAKNLAGKAAEIWLFPPLDSAVLETYRKISSVTKSERSYTIENYVQLTGSLKELFLELRKRILNLDASITQDFLKYYIAYKVDTNFVDVTPRKTKLILSLNIRPNEVHDPKGLCRDVSGIGHHGNGFVEMSIKDQSEIEDAVSLIRQALDKQIGGQTDAV